jgi:hypothetical protein
VSAVSLALTGLTVLLYILNKDEADPISSVIVPIWVFCLPPAYTYAYQWLKTRSFRQGFNLGHGAGEADIDGIPVPAFIITPIFIAPFLTLLYYHKNLHK